MRYVAASVVTDTLTHSHDYYNPCACTLRDGPYICKVMVDTTVVLALSVARSTTRFSAVYIITKCFRKC